MSKKGYTLDKGFLFSKDWERPLRRLPPEQFATLFWELYDFQNSKGEKAIPSHTDTHLDDLADLILPNIQNRLDGQKGAQNRSPHETDVGGVGATTPTTTPPTIPTTIPPPVLELSKDKSSGDDIKDDLSKSKSKVSAKADTDTYSKEFEKLWERYPNKKGKVKALQGYIKARREGVTFEAVEIGLEGYIRQIRAQKTTLEFIKHGSTWFSQNAWNDEYSTHNAPYRENETSILDDIF